MNHRTSKRRFGVIGLAVALLSMAACSIDASNQPPPTADVPEANGRRPSTSATPASTPAAPTTAATETVIRPTADVDNSSRSAMDVCTSDASAPAKRPSC